MHLLFTEHILKDSSRRILNPSYKKDEKSIKHYFIAKFKKLWLLLDTWDATNIYRGNATYRLSNWKHKFIYKKLPTSEFLLITYARKTDSDKLENNLLNIVKNTKKVQNKFDFRVKNHRIKE